MKEYASSVRNGISVYLYGNVFGIYLDVVSLVLGIGMARATVLELVDAGNLRIGKDYILSSIRIKAAFGVAWASVMLLPVHLPVPLCAKMAVFDATLPSAWTGRSTEPAGRRYTILLFFSFPNLCEVCKDLQGAEWPCIFVEKDL